MSEETKCVSCGCACMPADAVEHHDESSTNEEDHDQEAQFAVLLALVPAMTMTLFNMMGLL